MGKNTLEEKGGRKEGGKAEGWKVDVRRGEEGESMPTWHYNTSTSHPHITGKRCGIHCYVWGKQ